MLRTSCLDHEVSSSYCSATTNPVKNFSANVDSEHRIEASTSATAKNFDYGKVQIKCAPSRQSLNRNNSHLISENAHKNIYEKKKKIECDDPHYSSFDKRGNFQNKFNWSFSPSARNSPHNSRHIGEFRSSQSFQPLNSSEQRINDPSNERDSYFMKYSYNPGSSEFCNNVLPSLRNGMDFASKNVYSPTAAQYGRPPSYLFHNTSSIKSDPIAYQNQVFHSIFL